MSDEVPITTANHRQLTTHNLSLLLNRMFKLS